MSWRKVKVNIDEQVYEYMLGKQNAVIKIGDKKKIVDYQMLTGISWNVFERGQWKKTRDGMVTPKHVINYIQNHILNE